jgi:hypothetical protein
MAHIMSGVSTILWKVWRRSVNYNLQNFSVGPRSEVEDAARLVWNKDFRIAVQIPQGVADLLGGFPKYLGIEPAPLRFCVTSFVPRTFLDLVDDQDIAEHDHGVSELQLGRLRRGELISGETNSSRKRRLCNSLLIND